MQKIMAQRGVCSRRAAETLIRAGRVTVEGRPVSLGDKMDEEALLVVDGREVPALKTQKHLYIMLYKPRGYVTSAKDEKGRKTVMDLVQGLPRRVVPVGRLDMTSEGLLLLTSDGDFANRVAHPSNGVSKLYRLSVRPKATEEQIAKLAGGVVLDDGEQTAPASVRVVQEETGRSVLELSIREGKNRQIRRMCEAVGLDVIRLKRSAIGPVKLGMLQPGTWRELTKAEVKALMGWR